MIRTAFVTAVSGAAFFLPVPAGASYLPGSEPPVAYDCSALTARSKIVGRCETDMTRSVVSRAAVIGKAFVTTKGAEIGFTGDGSSHATSSASAETTQVVASEGLFRVRIEGASSTQQVECEDGVSEFAGSSHVERLVINGTEYRDLATGEFVTPFGTVTVGASVRDFHTSSFDALEGAVQSTVVVRSGEATVTIASAAIMVQGYPC